MRPGPPISSLSLFSVVTLTLLASAPAFADAPLRFYRCRVIADATHFPVGLGPPTISGSGRVAFQGTTEAGQAVARSSSQHSIPPHEILAETGNEPAEPQLLGDPVFRPGQAGVYYRALLNDGTTGIFYSGLTNPVAKTEDHASAPDHALVLIDDPVVTQSDVLFVGQRKDFVTGVFAAGEPAPLAPSGSSTELSASPTGPFYAFNAPPFRVEPSAPPSLPADTVLGFSIAGSFAPLLAWTGLSGELRMNGELWATPSEFDERGLSSVSINNVPEVVVVGFFGLYWADGNSVEEVICASVDDDPYPRSIGGIEISRRALNGTGMITFRGGSGSGQAIYLAQPNRVVNSRFDCDPGRDPRDPPNGWSSDPPGAATCSDDNFGSFGDGSGSVRMESGAAAGARAAVDPDDVQATQCVPAQPGPFSIQAQASVPYDFSGDGEAALRWSWYSADDCGGAPLGEGEKTQSLDNGMGETLAVLPEAPVETRSVRIHLVRMPATTADFVHFDDVLFASDAIPAPEPTTGLLGAASVLVLVAVARRRAKA